MPRVERGGIPWELSLGGVVWSTRASLAGTLGGGPFTLGEIARRVAPVLWFSADEPLFLRGNVPPEALPWPKTRNRTVSCVVRELWTVGPKVCADGW